MNLSNFLDRLTVSQISIIIVVLYDTYVVVNLELIHSLSTFDGGRWAVRLARIKRQFRRQIRLVGRARLVGRVRRHIFTRRFARALK
jgi:hypothetical protein